MAPTSNPYNQRGGVEKWMHKKWLEFFFGRIEYNNKKIVRRVVYIGYNYSGVCKIEIVPKQREHNMKSNRPMWKYMHINRWLCFSS